MGGPVQRLHEDVLRQGRLEDPLQRCALARDAQVHDARLQHDVQQQEEQEQALSQPKPKAAHAAGETKNLTERRSNPPGPNLGMSPSPITPILPKEPAKEAPRE